MKNSMNKHLWVAEESNLVCYLPNATLTQDYLHRPPCLNNKIITQISNI